MTENEKLDLILSEVQGMRTDMTNMKSDIQNLQENIEEMNHKITRIDLTIENEIRVNIRRVAEGHLDLSRNLHDVMKPSNELEMLSVKVRMLETNVKDLQEKIS